ncbi:MAG: transglycosylase SLT domain-containing protein [Acidobacteriota bacterium]
MIRQAAWHFQAGKKRYQEGDRNGARQEFDRAVDILLGAPDDVRAAGPAALDKKLEELVQAIHRYDLAGLGAADVSEEPGFEKALLDDIPPLTFPIDPRLKNRVIEEIRATASQLPLQANDAVLAYIHYFSTERGRRTLLAGLRRSGRYRPLIQRILAEEGLPQELIFIAQAESGFAPRAVSRKKAAGMWQFVRARGNQYGLMQTSFADDRLDPEKSTRAAARHLRDLYHQFGDWYLALVGYNAGPGVIDKAVQRTGHADFWEFRRRNVLPKETSNYVPIILAFTIMVKNAQQYGLAGLETDAPLEYDSLEITAPTGLQLLADLAECPLAQFRELNPALLKNLAPPGYTLRVPKGQGAALTAVLDAVPAERRNSWRAHRVGEGETLAAIAGRHRLPEKSILAVNGALSDGLQAGDLLLIPAAAPARNASARTTAVRKTPSRKPAVRRAAGASPVAYSAANLGAVRSRPAPVRR